MNHKGQVEKDSSTKIAKDLYITGRPEFKEQEKIFNEYAEKAFVKYLKNNEIFDAAVSAYKGFRFEGVKLRKYPVGGYFDWHTDTCSANTLDRFIVIAFYLNDVEEGGDTQIAGASKTIKCKEGKVAVFPASWMLLHKSNECISGPKYYGITFLKPDLTNEV